jgi:hypothetical protein
MSYTEYLRRKAVSSPKIIDTTVRTDASTITMRRRLAANTEFAIGSRQGVINNVFDPSQTGTSTNTKAALGVTKVSGGRIPDASLFTSYLGGQSIDNYNGIFQKPQRYTLNSNTAGSLSGCCIVDEPAPALPSGTVVGTVISNTTLLSASGTTLTVGVTPYTLGTTQKTVAPGGSITIAGAISRIAITGFTFTLGNVTATTASTAGIQNGTVVTIAGGTASAGNLGTFTVTSFVANTSITYANASGITEVRTATGSFTSPNNGTYTITSVISPIRVTVTNANAITDAVPTGTTTLSILVTGRSANTVPQNASVVAKLAESCRYPSTEGHIQSELGPALFVDNTIRLKNLVGCCDNEINQAIHTHPAEVPHNVNYQARPVKSKIPVFTVPSPSDARKVGNYDYKDHQKYVEKHHGNDLNVNPRQLIKKFQIPANTPAHLKINDPTQVPKL